MGFTFERDRFYSEVELRRDGLLSSTELRRGRKEGLRFKETKRGRRLYRGSWLLSWLTRQEAVRS